MVKSLLFVLDDERPVLALVTGDATVDADALARATGALRSGWPALARCASPPATPRCGAPVRAGHDVPVVADPGVFAPEVVYCGGGTTTTMLKIRSADLDALLGARRRSRPVATARRREERPTDGARSV